MKIPSWFFPATRLSIALRKEGFSVRRTDYLGIDDNSRWAVVKNGAYLGEIRRKYPFGELTLRTDGPFYDKKFPDIASQYTKK